MRIALVLLTRNEIHGVRAVFDRIPRTAVEEVLVVDGGSTDGTVEFLRDHGVQVLPQTSAGRGEAFRLAMQFMHGDAAIFFSPDGNEDPTDIQKFRSWLEEGYDMVIATRMVCGARNEEDGHWLPLRKWANQAFNLMANVTWGRGPFISDTINGFRAITKQAWRRVSPDALGYAVEYQTSIRAMKLRLRVAEFPTHEAPRIGPGGSPSFKTGLAFLRLYLRELWIGRRFEQRLAKSPHDPTGMELEPTA